MSSAELLKALLFFGRFLGFFLVSPLFGNRHIPVITRVGLACVCTLVLTPPLSFSMEAPAQNALFLLQIIKEVAVGYLLGFLFALLFEAAALAGQIVGVMGGFSVTELLDPNEFSQNSILGKLFATLAFMLFLSLDLHHFLLRFLYESFQVIPLMPDKETLMIAGGKLFHYALDFAFVPLLFLSGLLLIFALISRALPDLPIFWVGFPLQVLVALFALLLALGFYTEIVQKAFLEILTLTKRMFFPL